MRLFNAVDETEIDWIQLAKSTAHESWGRKRGPIECRLEWMKIRNKVTDVGSKTLRSMPLYFYLNSNLLGRNHQVLYQKLLDSCPETAHF